MTYNNVHMKMHTKYRFILYFNTLHAIHLKQIVLLQMCISLAHNINKFQFRKLVYNTNVQLAEARGYNPRQTFRI